MADIKKLIEDLKNQNNDVVARENAISGLSDAAAKGVNISNAIPVLIVALSDKSSIIRGSVADALGAAASNGIDISSAIPALERAASDSIPYVSESANKALQAASGERTSSSRSFNITYQGKKQTSKWGPVIFLLMGLLFFGVGIYFIWNDYNALSWALVNGVITFSEMSDHYDSDGDRLFSAEIDYRYTYDGKAHRGNCCGFSTSDFNSIAKIVGNNAVGKEVEILVNPDDPYSSRLKDDVNPFNIFYLIFAGMGALFAIIGAYLTNKAWKGELH